MKSFIPFVLIVQIIFWSCCKSSDNISPDATIVLNNATMQNQIGQRSISLNWTTTGNINNIQKYVVQYSLNHAAWVDFQEINQYNATNFSAPLPDEPFYYNHTYAWRVKAIQGTQEFISCNKNAFMPLNGSETAAFGIIKLNTPNYTTSQATLEFSIQPNNLAGLAAGGAHYVIEKKDGNNWLPLIDNKGVIISSTTFTIPTTPLISGQTYRVFIHGTETYYGKSNNIIFTFSNPMDNICP